MNGDARMEENRFLTLLRSFQAGIDLTQNPAAEEPGIAALAYLGDSVYELWVRLGLVTGRTRTAGVSLHRGAVQKVCAESQAATLRRLEPELTETERDLVRRARNAKVGVVPRNGQPVQYRLATAFEALIGYLFWHGELERLVQILFYTEKDDTRAEDNS